MQKCKNAKNILYSADIAHDITFAFLHFLCKTCKKGQNEGVLRKGNFGFLASIRHADHTSIKE